MGTKTIRLDEDVYERLRSRKRDDETFSEVVDRLVDDWSLLDLAETSSPSDAERHRELLARAEEAAHRDRDELLDQFGADGE